MSISDIRSDLSTYEKRMASLREEIASLELENVGKKDWTLMGEATSRSRPQNSLLEEDLEFERVMKSVPVITEDVVHSLEERIKSRVLENQFDDVVRKRPVDDKPFLPSRFFELQDSKSKQSLAEIYEDEYTAAQSGSIAGEDRDGKLKKEHEEIERMWENICGKLDALCNAHFTPKAVSIMFVLFPDGYLICSEAQGYYHQRLERRSRKLGVGTPDYESNVYNAGSGRDLCPRLRQSARA